MHNPRDDETSGCDVCGKAVEVCICPECPICGEAGQIRCFVEHTLQFHELIRVAERVAITAYEAAKQATIQKAADELVHVEEYAFIDEGEYAAAQNV